MTNESGFTFELDTKAVSDQGAFTGYASIFGNEDQGRDIVLPGAFLKSLERRPASRVKMLRQHDTAEPIGIWTELREDTKGLQATGQLILETAKGRETHALLRAGALDGLSIGFKSVRDRFDRTKSARLIEEADLWEISVVTFPMNPRATVSAVKSQEEVEAHAHALVKAINKITEGLLR
jgi:HK97 family phage prohead protease